MQSLRSASPSSGAILLAEKALSNTTSGVFAWLAHRTIQSPTIPLEWYAAICEFRRDSHRWRAQVETRHPLQAASLVGPRSSNTRLKALSFGPLPPSHTTRVVLNRLPALFLRATKRAQQGNLLTRCRRELYAGPMKDDATWTVETDKGVSLCSHKLRVEFLRGPLEGKIFELPGPEIRMGSGTDCDVVIPDRTVSHQHAVLRIEKSGIRVIDSKSRNGTLVDNVRIRDAYARPDASISMGASAMRLQMIQEVVELPLSTRDHFGALIGRSVAMRKVYALLERVAGTDTTVLIEGETGTGKELVAAAIHEASPRAQQPFVVFDCSAVPSDLIESELFGHVRGAYTNAVGDRKGRFREANGGTLFLDEIGELPLELQPKLLRALESRTIRSLGADREQVVDVRVVAATNRNLAIEVDRGQFREDLYYRIAVVPVRLPPLRERIDDIPLLVRRFEHDWRSRPNRPAPIPDTVIERMKQLSWPGNIRELRNKVDMMLSLGLATLPGARQYESPNSNGPLDVDVDMPFHSWRERLLESSTKAYFAAALEKNKGNVSQTATLAGVSRAFLQRIMKRLDLRNSNEE